TEMCGGVQVMITDYSKVRPVEASIYVLEAVMKLYPEADVLYAKPGAPQNRVSMFNKVMGTDQVRADLLAGKSAKEIVEGWRPEREKFAEEREKYFLYQ